MCARERSWIDFGTDLLFARALAVEGRHALLAVSVASLCLCALCGWTVAGIELRRAWSDECVRAGSSHVDFVAFGKRAAGYAAVLMLCGTNANLLILLPWRGGTPYVGLPSAKLLWRTQIVSMVEDVPNIAVQIAYLALPNATAPELAALSLLSSVLSMAWRLLRKLLGGLGATNAERMRERGSTFASFRKGVASFRRGASPSGRKGTFSLQILGNPTVQPRLVSGQLPSDALPAEKAIRNPKRTKPGDQDHDQPGKTDACEMGGTTLSTIGFQIADRI